MYSTDIILIGKQRELCNEISYNLQDVNRNRVQYHLWDITARERDSNLLSHFYTTFIMSKNDTSLAAYLERMGVEIVCSLNRHQYATVDKYRR